MSFNGSGTFVINSSGQPVAANTVISSTVFNALTADLATGLSTCITKDGQTTPTANIPMGTFKFTNLGNGSAATDSATLGQVQASTTKLVTVTGTDTITGTMAPALTAYASGQMFYFVAGGANTGAVTLNIDGLGARNVTRHGSVALVAGDILSGEVCVVVYDGTRFQLLNPASYTNLNVTGVLSLAAGAVATPSLTFTGDLNTGLWSPAADTIAASTGGVERLRVDSSGNVGIGTSSPVSKFHVSSATAVATYSTTGNLNGGTVIGVTAAGVSNIATYASNALTFGNYNLGGAASEFMRLDSSGNLGIGTASPANRLSINDPGTGLGLTNAASGNFNIGLLAGTGSALAYVFQRANSDLLFGTNNAEVARFTAAGNLGIGTASPQTRLHVQGTGTTATRISSLTSGNAVLELNAEGTDGGSVLFNRSTIAMEISTSGGVVGQFDANRNATIGAGTLATNATNGFLYVPTCAGVPTGTPTAKTGYAPIVVNTTNNKLYFYSGGAWRDAGP